MAIATLVIFVLTYLVLAIGRLPGFQIDRTGATIVGASLLVGIEALTFEEAYRAINYDTLVLLFGMMIVVANLRLSGFFGVVTEWVVERAHHPLALLSAIVVVAGVFSAFFVNDTMCIVLTPLVVDIAVSLRRNPMPYVLGVAMGSNIGSVATVTGNPQNMMIGSFSGIAYGEFAAALAPVAAAGLAIAIAVLALIYRAEIFSARRVDVERRKIRVNRVLLWKSVAAGFGMIAMFFAGWPVPRVALIAGALLLVTRRVKPEKVYRQIDWPLLVLFVGLFVVVAAFEKSEYEESLRNLISRLNLENTAVLASLAAAISNLVSNVPAVLLFKPFLAHVADPKHAWLVLAMASTLAGNLTLLGSVANLIVAQRAKPAVNVTFLEYLKAGVPVTVLTLLAGVAMLGHSVPRTSFIVTPEWLAKQNARPVILEASWAPLEKAEDYRAGHVPGAIHVNTDIFESGHPRWHLRPLPELQAAIGGLGIGPESTVVVYGKKTIAAARVWWILYYAGVRDVRILDGGFEAWTRAGLPVETEPRNAVPATFTARAREEALATTGWVQENRERVLLADVRSEREFKGETSGYSYLQAKGRVPGSVHFGDADDSSRLYRHADGTLLKPAEIRALWRKAFPSSDHEVVFYCGGGWRSSLAFLYAKELGIPRVRNYSDGWSGWSDRFPSQ